MRTFVLTGESWCPSYEVAYRNQHFLLLEGYDVPRGHESLQIGFLKYHFRVSSNLVLTSSHLVSTMRNRALPCIMRAYASAALSRGAVSIIGRISWRTL